MDDITTPLSHQLQVQRQIEESRAEVLNQIIEVRHHHAKQLEIINKNLKRIAMQPVLRPSGLIRSRSRVVSNESKEDQEEIEREVVQIIKAKLYRSPKKLFDLWHQNQFSLNCCKQTKEFILEERGKVKSVYWKKIFFGISLHCYSIQVIQVKWQNSRYMYATAEIKK